MARDLVVRYLGDAEPLKQATPVVQAQLAAAGSAAEKMQRRFEAAAAKSGRAGAAAGKGLAQGLLKAAASQVVSRAGSAIGNAVYDKASARIGQSSIFQRFTQNAPKAGQAAGQAVGKKVVAGVEQRASRVRWEVLKSPKVVAVALAAGLLFGRRFAASAEKQAGSSFKPDGILKRITGSARAGVVGIAAGVAGAGVGVAAGLSSVIKGASDAEQSIGAVEAIFGKYAASVQRDSKQAAGSLGINANAYRELASTTGSLLKNKGIKDYAGQTRSLISLGADLAAQYGGSSKDAVEALGSALRGETDPIERYGVSMNQTAIEAEGLALGLAKPIKNARDISIAQGRATVAQGRYNAAVKAHGKDSLQATAAQASLGSAQRGLEKAAAGATPKLTDQQKAMAALSLVSKQTASAQGTAARESDTFASKQAAATAKWENLTVAIGNRFLPLATQAMGFIADRAIPAVSRWVGETKGLGPTLTSVGGLLKAFGVIAATVFGGAGTALFKNYQRGLQTMLDYLITHQVAIVSGFVSAGNAVLDFGGALVQLGVTGLNGFAALSTGLAVFVEGGTRALGDLIRAAVPLSFLLGPVVGLQFLKAAENFGAVEAGAARTAAGLRGAGDGARNMAGLLESTATPALQRTRDRLAEVGKQEVFKAAQRDQVARFTIAAREAAAAVQGIGTQSDGSQVRLKRWSDVTNLGAKEQAGLRSRIDKARSALYEQITAQQKAGGSQKDLTKTWETGKRRLYDEFVQMGLSKKEAGKLAEKYAGVKPKVETKVTTPGMTAAQQNAQKLADKINKVPNANVKITFSSNAAALAKSVGYSIGVKSATGSADRRAARDPLAAGGTVRGRGGPREDNILGFDSRTGMQTAAVSVGEEVIRERSARANRGALKAINAGDGKRFVVQPLADGGTVRRNITVGAGRVPPFDEAAVSTFADRAAQSFATGFAKSTQQKLNAAAAAEAASGSVGVGGGGGSVKGKGGRVWPTTGRITSTYRGHDGVDINGPGDDGGNPIYAYRSGVITHAGYGRGYGNAVFEQPDVGPRVVYGHGRRVFVRGGQRVTVGQKIAEVGTTGRSSGNHLHFGVPGGTYSQAINLLRGLADGGTVRGLAQGGIVKGGSGGVTARVGEGRFDELVTPLPPGWNLSQQNGSMIAKLITALVNPLRQIQTNTKLAAAANSKANYENAKTAQPRQYLFDTTRRNIRAKVSRNELREDVDRLRKLADASHAGTKAEKEALRVRVARLSREAAATKGVTKADRDLKAARADLADATAKNSKTTRADKALKEARDKLAAANLKVTATGDKRALAQDQYDKVAEKARSATDRLREAQAALSEQLQAVADQARATSEAFSSKYTGSALTDPADIIAQQNAGAAELTKFNSQIAALRKAGLNETSIRDIVDRGAVGGGDLATAILGSGKRIVDALNAAQKNLTGAADKLGLNVAVGTVRRSGGGWVFGAGTSTSDSIDMKASNGEFYVNAASARANAALLQQINSSARPVAIRRNLGGPLQPGPTIVRTSPAPAGGGLSAADRDLLTGGRTVVEVAADSRGFTDLIRVTVRDELRKAKVPV